MERHVVAQLRRFKRKLRERHLAVETSLLAVGFVLQLFLLPPGTDRQTDTLHTRRNHHHRRIFFVKKQFELRDTSHTTAVSVKIDENDQTQNTNAKLICNAPINPSQNKKAVLSQT